MRQFDFSADDELETEPGTLTYAQTEALAASLAAPVQRPEQPAPSVSLGNTETAPTLRGLESRGGDLRDGASQDGVAGVKLLSTPRRASES